MAELQKKVGIIIEIVDDRTYKVDVNELKHEFVAEISRKSKILSDSFGTTPKLGDRVLVEYSPYDSTRGRIDSKTLYPDFWSTDGKIYL